jgi:hypothetical protein
MLTPTSHRRWCAARSARSRWASQQCASPARRGAHANAPASAPHRPSSHCYADARVSCRGRSGEVRGSSVGGSSPSELTPRANSAAGKGGALQSSTRLPSCPHCKKPLPKCAAAAPRPQAVARSHVRQVRLVPGAAHSGHRSAAHPVRVDAAAACWTALANVPHQHTRRRREGASLSSARAGWSRTDRPGLRRTGTARTRSLRNSSGSGSRGARTAGTAATWSTSRRCGPAEAPRDAHALAPSRTVVQDAR